jgi:NAD(P)-dependent dehydrogenase (short-subunit alcohol dehydrogenase family)
MDHRDLIDAALELAIVPSFSSIGPRVRGRLWGWTDPAPGALAGRTAVVTGATGGLGRVVSLGLAELGARVLLVGRDAEKLESLRKEIAGRQGDERAASFEADMASLESIRAAAGAITASETRLDVVVDNAGAISAERTTSGDGFEMSMALMAIGPFAFVSALLPLLRRSDDARVIAVTSGGMYAQTLDVEDLDGNDIDYNGPRFYARAKRAQVSLVREWARRTEGGSVTFHAMHPGWARTHGLSASLPGFDKLMGPLLRSPEEGADTIVWLATAPDAELGSGRLFLDRRARPFDRVPWTRLSARERRALWREVVRRAGVEDPAPD